MSRAVVATAYGGPEVLAVIEETLEPPGPGEVLVDVRAAAVNPADIKSYSGAWGSDPAALPKRLGFEAAGVVRAAGPDVVGPAGPIAVGDEVIVYPVSGAYADQLRVSATSILPKPSRFSWGQASGLMLTGVAAVHTVTASRVGLGDTVLIHGAAGAVGFVAAQLAVARGARVIGTASLSAHDLVRSIGAEPVAYGEGLAGRVRALAPDGIDAAIDTVGSEEAIDVSLGLVADRSRVVSIAAFGRAADGITLLGVGGDPGTELRQAARLNLVRLVQAGDLKVMVAGTYPLAEAAEAHRALALPHARPPGKLVLLPG